MMTRLNSQEAALRAPGPGAMRPAEWAPLAERHLKEKRVILYADGARAYKLKVRGMKYDHVARQKRELARGGKFVKGIRAGEAGFTKTSPGGRRPPSRPARLARRVSPVLRGRELPRASRPAAARPPSL